MTLADLLRERAEQYRDKLAFSFSYHGDDADRSQLTYRELDVKARAIAANLQQQGAAGQRVLVVCRSGLEQLAGFFGCFYAGAIAVPVHEQHAPPLSAVVTDAEPSFAVVHPETPMKVRAAVDTLVGLIDGPPLRWCVTTEGDAEQWTEPDVDPDTIALLQYTSGSTASPKGVLLTHRNVLDNIEGIHRMCGSDDQSVAMCWLPQHHNMGLIAIAIQQLHAGATTHLMSPIAFMERPMAWLEAISRCRATITAAPNFAYVRCVEQSTPAERAALDLSSLSTVIGGSEPIRGADIQAFAEAFAPAGLRPDVFSTSYGLAEATVTVCGGSDSPFPLSQHLDGAALGENRVVDAEPGAPGTVEVVGCGPPLPGQRVIIVDPETRRERQVDEVGEVWVTGPNVAQGYWRRPDETEQTFAAFLSETGEGPFLRTGDQGFLRSGELFISGRCTDLVVVDGANFYPNHVEATVQGCHPALLAGRGAAFTVKAEPGAADQLVVVQEVDRNRIDPAVLNEVVTEIRAAITERHGIGVDAVLLVEGAQLPTTSIGKIQRGRCRQQFLDRELEGIVEWYAPLPAKSGNPVQARLAELITRAAARRQRATERG